MNKQLFLKLCFIFATGIVGLFFVIHLLTIYVEERMSMLNLEDRKVITQWGKQAEQFYKNNDVIGLNAFIAQLKHEEKTWVSVVSFDYVEQAGDKIPEVYKGEHTLGRSVDWKIHLYFSTNPVMEVPFNDVNASFLIQLPERMRPGTYWRCMQIFLQIVLPAVLLCLLAFFLYRFVMKPLRQLQQATEHFSRGNFDVRAINLMGRRKDEFYELATTFDDMASRIGEQIVSQRQLIADLSHELRTPLTRLDIALSAVNDEQYTANVERINRESRHIRTLVEDTLTLAWLDNEQPNLDKETLDLVDLLDVLIGDAKFEFPDRKVVVSFPESALIHNSCHRAVGQAVENILRNALRYTPTDKTVTVNLFERSNIYVIEVKDEGPGVPDELLQSIFKPFFRVDESRERNGSSFGLGLALARRQLETVKGSIIALNNPDIGLTMTITLPKYG